MTDRILLEDGGRTLLEDGSFLLEESAVVTLSLSAVYGPSWATSVIGPVGPQSTVVSNADGSLLVLFAAWETTLAVNATCPVPASSVCDSQGNWWVLAGDSGSDCEAARCAIWYCANARAGASTGWLSFALQGYADSLLWTVAEFAGPPAGYTPVIDFVVPSNSGTTPETTFAVGGLTLQADYCFAIGATASVDAGIATSPSSPWHVISTGGTGSPGAISASCAYATAASGTALSADWTFNGLTPGPAAGVVVALSQASFPPASNGNANYPNVRVQAAFGAAANDSTAALLDYQWVDLTDRALAGSQVASITTSRGKQYELSQPEAGALTVALSNLDGAFSPLNPGSPYYSNALNSNMSFQSGTSPWDATGCTITRSSAHAYASAREAVAQYSMQVVTDGSTAFPHAFSELVPVNENGVYSMSFSALCPAGYASGAIASIDWFDSSQVYISTSSSSAVPLPATSTDWTQVTFSDFPAAGAAYATGDFKLNGTPPLHTTAYVAEAALAVGTAPVATGLVRLGTPVRVSAYWHDRWNAVGFGYVERWPQDWPELPQWGFSVLTATDQAGAANAINLTSALEGEMLASSPYLLFPFADDYSSSSTTLNGNVASAVNCSGNIAVSTSRNSQRSALYVGYNTAVETGQTVSFACDANTGMGASSYNAVDTSGARGPGVVYGPDAGLPSLTSTAGATFELWVATPSGPTNPVSADQLFPYLQVLGPPYIGSTAGDTFDIPGLLAALGMQLPQTSGAPSLFVQQPPDAILTLLPGYSFDRMHHIVLSIDAGGVATAYLDANGTLLSFTILGDVTALVFGQASYSYGGSYTYWNYSSALGGVYPYALSQNQVTRHYGAGQNGFAGDRFVKRFGRYVAWANAAVMPGGPGSTPDPLALSAAYGITQSSLASALNADAQSSGGLWYASAAGNLITLPRQAIYDQPSLVTFGDDPSLGEVPYTTKLGFDYDNTYVSNVVMSTLQQGQQTLVSPVLKDEASVAEYGQRGPLALTTAAQSPEDAFDAVSWNLAKYAQPSMRVREITIDAASHPDAFDAVLTTEVSNVATVIRRPVGAPEYRLPVITQRVSHDIGPGYWQTSYQQSPYIQEASVLQSSVTGYDILGSGTLAW